MIALISTAHAEIAPHASGAGLICPAGRYLPRIPHVAAFKRSGSRSVYAKVAIPKPASMNFSIASLPPNPPRAGAGTRLPSSFHIIEDLMPESVTADAFVAKFASRKTADGFVAAT